MTDPHFMILYVEDPQRSSDFYAALLGKQPVCSSPVFVEFALDSGLGLGLWKRDMTAPPAQTMGDMGELCSTLENDAAVDTKHAEWVKRGLRIVQEPTRMDFGYTFVALDPDGHRLRAFAPSAPTS